MKNVTTILAICVVVMLTGCNDYLDIKPKGEKIPTTVSDYETLLNYESVQKVSDTYPAYLTDDVFLPDVAEGTATPGLNSVDQSIRNLYLFKKEVFGDAQDDGFWFASYNRIYYYNTVIDNIMNADGSDEQQKLSIRAEALISRALEYLYLVNGYAKYYDVRTAESDPGVPLILDEDISKKNLVRASVKDVYAQIQSDLQTALPNLPMQAKGNAFRASKAAGYGVLAKMYLYMGNYAEALKAANEVLEINNSLLDMDKATLLEDSKIVYLRLDDETTYNVRKNSIVYKLEGIDLFEELKLESLEKVFGDKLWLRPPSGTPDASQLHYGIQWITNSDDLFWNQYYSYISFDSTNRMTSFSIYTQIGRDK